MSAAKSMRVSRETEMGQGILSLPDGGGSVGSATRREEAVRHVTRWEDVLQQGAHRRGGGPDDSLDGKSSQGQGEYGNQEGTVYFR